ncbi:hypothetical protein CGC20_35850 [Leishmania donovani]|uniref:Uncharacterized protein n=1 Tax=Leishmania donovani TaxID=5661 RepID=A0A504XVT0_LEIDO|nr:hypothetical protein CGC20_35850 [Leishmania donovani]
MKLLPCICRFRTSGLSRARARSRLLFHLWMHHPQHHAGIFMENGVPRTRKLRHPKRYSARYASAPSPAPSRSPPISAASNGAVDLAKVAPWVRGHRCEESPTRLRCCPGLEEQRRRGIADASAAKVAFAASHSMFLCDPFGLCNGLIAGKQLCMGILVHGQASRGLMLPRLQTDYASCQWHLMSTEDRGKGERPTAHMEIVSVDGPITMLLREEVQVSEDTCWETKRMLTWGEWQRVWEDMDDAVSEELHRGTTHPRRNICGHSSAFPSSVLDLWNARKASLQGRHSVYRLILLVASTAERTDAAQAAAQATTAPSAANGPQLQFVDATVVVFLSTIYGAAFDGRDMTPPENHNTALALARAFDSLLNSGVALARAHPLQRKFPGRADDGPRGPDVFNREEEHETGGGARVAQLRSPRSLPEPLADRHGLPMDPHTCGRNLHAVRKLDQSHHGLTGLSAGSCVSGVKRYAQKRCKRWQHDWLVAPCNAARRARHVQVDVWAGLMQIAGTCRAVKQAAGSVIQAACRLKVTVNRDEAEVGCSEHAAAQQAADDDRCGVRPLHRRDIGRTGSRVHEAGGRASRLHGHAMGPRPRRAFRCGSAPGGAFALFVWNCKGRLMHRPTFMWVARLPSLLSERAAHTAAKRPPTSRAVIPSIQC